MPTCHDNLPQSPASPNPNGEKTTVLRRVFRCAMAPRGSQVSPATGLEEEEELGRSFLRELDTNLVGALQSGAIRLLDTNALREGSLSSAEPRQALEAREEAGERLFLTSLDAVTALQSNRRAIGFLSYGWRTRRHPDPDGITLRAIVEALRYQSCAHIVGIFWDFMSLHQAPRTEAQAATFRIGLQVMGDGYSSPLGVTVLQCKGVPPAPDALALACSLVGVPEGADAVRMLTTAPGSTLKAADVGKVFFEEELVLPGATPDRANGSLVLTVTSEAALMALHAAVATTQPSWALYPRYHAVPYDERG